MVGKGLGNTHSLEYIRGVPKNGPVLILQMVLEVVVFRHTRCGLLIIIFSSSKDNICLVQQQRKIIKIEV